MTARTMSDINALATEAFVAAFGDVAEHSPWVAEAAAAARPFASREAMIAAFEAAILSADPDRQLALIRAHPDLAGRAAIAGEIAAESRREQAGIGLDRLTPEEFARFTALNDRYRETFGFPFILAVKNATKNIILTSFEARLGNNSKTERETALAQIARIVRFRIEDRVA
ncbi:2-oxo-4-hydroxy-4-carboxy-5-ureidoimidazoline decarboxylase [Segnochrobactrum spirostomi]|uniref:2-oxo-4-hydroxy-4-carboxy-5-ureidoimidazoline decarboxylase n=1 Tax=Segnochrobactrum spirostomi TaxID=2608987 RepID=A0A6A7XZZ0_9HYPH|nr:2-oxo-4-hydroxy-4-carboxy-5-ureidoimidazoline decarboxylase [Segnochrobactrum spirostomi]MQT11319.1 2-oxo-4-hydroxy-4-carboxy-5-ureidoimidazoline decarboxylase [Segnochrobactrum spirostomi]